MMSGLGYTEDSKKTFVNLSFHSMYILENLLCVKRRNDISTQGNIHNYETRNKVNLVPIHCTLRKCQNKPEYIATKLFVKLRLTMRHLATIILFKQQVRETEIKKRLIQHGRIVNLILFQLFA